MVSAVVFVGAGSASAGSAVAVMAIIDNCQNSTAPPETRIEACSEIIHANLVPHRFLAAFYDNRGTAYEAAQSFDLALKDYDKALELSPDLAEAQRNKDRLMRQHPAASTD